ncbi:MAG: hypothetical protein L0338_20265 [Acidobacteria bacterium]|nr:hypothetical protein [Acidobacteriota bacterium]
MITLRTRTHVDGLTGEQVYGFLMNATDREYQEWWLGVHLQLVTLKRCPNNVGKIVYMDEFIGEYRVKMTGVVVEAILGKKLVWQLKKGVRLPVRLSLKLDDDEAGVFITHTIRVGFEGLGSALDMAFRMYFSGKFAAAMDEHVKAEFPKLRDMLARTAGTSPVASS